MKITLIGSLGKYNAEDLYIRAFNALGHDITFINQYEGVNRGTLTRLLVTRVSSMRFILKHFKVNKIKDLGNPDLVLVFKGELLNESLLKVLNEYNSYLFFPDTFRFKLLLKNRLQHFKGVIVTTPFTDYYKKMGARKVVYTNWACDPEVHRPLKTDKMYDVSFIGTFYPNRWRLLRKVKPSTHVFGNFWFLKVGIHHPAVYGEDYIKTINQSKININIHHPADLLALSPNMRTFEVAGTGGFLITEYMPGIKELFKKIETYSSAKELNEKIAYYLQNEKERQEIGNSLRDECIRKHTYIMRAQNILEQT
ncbi:MAG: CgeB family protein [Nitrososphaeria archaeon]